MRDPTAKRRRRMSDENKPPPPPPQPLFRFRSPEELERSPVWQAKRAYATAERMRERGLLPEFPPEMIERLRQAQPSEDSLVTELVRRAQELAREQREQREQAEEAERSNVDKPVRAEEEKRPNVDKPSATTETPDSAQVEGATAVNTAEAVIENVADRKKRSGRPPNEIPYFDVVMLELVEKYPNVRKQIREMHMTFLVERVRHRGEKIDSVRHPDGSANKTFKQFLRGRMKSWLEDHPPGS